MKIWVDDIRLAPEGWVHLWTSWQAIAYLQGCKEAGEVPEIMSLDHDLGGDDTTRPIVLWMCENDFWPVEVRVHSANPVGIEWLEGMITRYKPLANDVCGKCGGLLLEDRSHATNDRRPCYGVS